MIGPPSVDGRKAFAVVVVRTLILTMSTVVSMSVRIVVFCGVVRMISCYLW